MTESTTSTAPITGTTPVKQAGDNGGEKPSGFWKLDLGHLLDGLAILISSVAIALTIGQLTQEKNLSLKSNTVSYCSDLYEKIETKKDNIIAGNIGFDPEDRMIKEEPITAKEIAALKTNKAHTHLVKKYLTQLELSATLVNKNAIDEDICKAFFEDIFCDAYLFFEPLVKVIRDTSGEPETYAELERLQKRWKPKGWGK